VMPCLHPARSLLDSCHWVVAGIHV
jgi:hypothetical protein